MVALEIMSFEGYQEALESQKEKEDALATLSDQVMKLIEEVQELKKRNPKHESE
jgi:hypothetical protein